MIPPSDTRIISLTTVSNHYNDTVTALAGKQGLYGKVDRFNQLSTKVSRSLPALEASHRDFEHDRLALIAEPLEESSVMTDDTLTWTDPSATGDGL